MYFKSLTLNNFKRVSNATLEFSKINILSGKNYSGKSSIISALIYLFTNYLEEKIQHYVKWDANGFSLSSSIMDSKNEYDYNIKYSKNTEKLLTINGVDKFINSEASKKFAQIIDPNLAFYSSVSMQGQSTNVIFDSPTSRGNILKEILGLDKLVTMSELMKSDISSREVREQVVKGELNILENSKYQYLSIPEIENIEDIISQFEIMKSLKKEYDIKQAEYQLYLDKLVSFKRVKDKIIFLENQCDSSKSEIENLKTKLLPNIDFDIDRLLTINNLISSLNKEKYSYDLQVSNIRKFEEKRDYVIKQIKEKEVLNESLVLSRIRKPSVDEQSLYRKVEDLKSNQAELNILLKNKTLFASGKCPTCSQLYHGDMTKLEEDIKFRQEEIKTINSDITDIQNVLKEYNQLFENQKIIMSKKETLAKEVQNFNSELGNIELQIVTLNSSLTFNEKEFDDKISSLEKEAQDLTTKQLEANRIKKSNEFTEESIKKLTNLIQVNIQTIESLRNESEPILVIQPQIYDVELYESLQRKINIHETNIANREKAISHNEIIKKKEEEDKLLLSELKVELDDLYTNIQILKFSKNILDKDLSPFLLETGVIDIVTIMNHVFTKIHPDYEISIKQEKKNLEFFYNYLDSKGERLSHPVLMASGFERQIISLCFKLALTILSGSRILFLDETDSDASEENSIIFYDRLLETNVLDQVFIVSHKPETVNHLINSFNARCFYLENGQITKVEN